MLNILLTNDDGVFSPGIDTVFNRLSSLPNLNVKVMAPLEERSTTGHTLTLDHPLRMKQLKENYFGCSGYPADCVLLAKGTIFKDQKIDLVISGVNRGANLGQDIFYSGTVAAAREASFHGIKSIAVSLDTSYEHVSEHLYFETAAKFIENLVKKSIQDIIKPMSVLNINIPNYDFDNIKGIELTNIGFRKYSETVSKRVDFRNRDYYWIGGTYEGFDNKIHSDCTCVDQGKISITSLNLLNHRDEETNSISKFLQKL